MNDFLNQMIRQLTDILGQLQDELAGLLWVNTLEARKREKDVISAIIAHNHAIDELEAMQVQ